MNERPVIPMWPVWVTTLLKVIGVIFLILLLSHWLTGGQDEITDFQNYQSPSSSTGPTP